MAWVYSEKLKAETGNGWSDEPEPSTAALAVASPADILTAGGIQRAPEVVELAAAAGLDLAAAAVVLIKESGGGYNVFGHDHVPTGGAYVPGSPVTQQSYDSYHAAVLAGKAGRQGVGPTQLTYWALQDEADSIGGCWNWTCNITIGFKTLAGLIRANGLRNGFRAFNGSGPAAEAYAADSMAKYAVWATRLGVTPGGGGAVDDMTPEEDQRLSDIWQQLLGTYPAWGGGMTDANHTPYDLVQYALRGNVQLTQLTLMAQQLLQAKQAPSQVKIDVDRLAQRLHEKAASLSGEITTVSFWKAVGERAAKSFAGSLVTLFGAGPLNVLHIDYQTTLGLAAGAALISVLMSVASSTVATPASPSLIKGGNS
jgi:hypothetical protein